jgi:hypothetical protein
MLKRYLASSGISALVGAATLALPLNSASAFTLSAPSREPAAAVEKIQYRHGVGGGFHGGYGYRGGYGYHHGWGGWGWGPGAVIGGLAAGAIVGSALAAPYYYGPGYYGPGYYGPCWRWVAGPWGWHWARFC